MLCFCVAFIKDMERDLPEDRGVLVVGMEMPCMYVFLICS